MRRGPLALAVMLLVALALTGCSSAVSADREVKITATEMKFEPAVIEAKVGEKIKFAIQNQGTVDHEFESETLKFDELEIPPGKTRTVTVTMPDKPGEYEFFCDAAGHLAAGMKGKVVVSR